MLSKNSLTRKKLLLLVICDLLAGQISCSAELSMKKFYNQTINTFSLKKEKIP